LTLFRVPFASTLTGDGFKVILEETMSEQEQQENTRTSGAVSRHEKRSSRLPIYAAILLLVFLLGFVPTCFVARRRGLERDTAQTALRISNLQNSLGNAIVDARAGNYERARQGTSDFFSNLATEVERSSTFNDAQETQLRPLLQERDDTITVLARSDPNSADRLTKLYSQYREATTTVAAH
jgi:hypothetical protein